MEPCTYIQIYITIYTLHKNKTKLAITQYTQRSEHTLIEHSFAICNNQNFVLILNIKMCVASYVYTTGKIIAKE